MKSLTWLWRSILTDVGLLCATDTHLDAVTVSRRIEHEGISFLTISLPSFCSDFERSLSIGYVDSKAFLGFKRAQALPAFLQGLLSQVFDPVSGRLLGDPSISAISGVRQICLAFKKVQIPCTITRTRRSLDAYLQVEDELKARDTFDPRHSSIIDEVRGIAGVIWAGGLGRMYNCISDQQLQPRHGPGATAERGLRGNAKFSAWLPSLETFQGRKGNERFRAHAPWHQRLEEHFPFYPTAAPLAALGLENSVPTSSVELVEPEAESPVRVITVPKTQKTPRIIAIEPLCMQYTQQLLLDPLVKVIEGQGVSSGHVNFRDQTINQNLARISSNSGKFATIDLSEASDRVSLDLAESMFASCPIIWDMILACRSTRAELPTGKVISLKKFASMGSALCFPVESMVFFTIMILGALKSANLPSTTRNIRNVSRDIYVYGDDLIIPVDQVETTIELLEALSLKVNRSKSFWTGKFRESCGVDAYDGIDITPVYVRHLPPGSRQHVSELLSYVSLANQLYLKGYWESARRVRELVESILGPLPHVLDSSPCLGWTSFSNSYSVTRWSDSLHRFEVKAWVMTQPQVVDPLTGYGALMKYFLKRGSHPIYGKHLERTVRPGSVRINRRWASPH